MQRAAALIEQNKKRLINDWVQLVRQELPAPNETIDPVLRDHVPLLLDDIVSILRQYEIFDLEGEIQSFDGMLDNSLGHGRHRSSASGYDMEQVLKEYISLHKILTQLLRSHGIYTTEVADALKYIIEESMTFAAVSFQNSLLEVRQKLMGVLVHDVRNPISAALLAASLLEQDAESEKFNKIRDMLKTSIKRALKLMESFLESVSVGAGEGITLHFSEKDLLLYIQSVHGEASAIYSNNVILECPDKPIMGVFDSAMIRRVLENIVNNAVKYGGRDTPITIKVEDEPDTVTIIIHNLGNPIPEEEQKEIFKFLNTKKTSTPTTLKSWGMGLTLVNAVAEAHGGYLKLISNEEEGTNFILVLKKNANPPGKIKTRILFGYQNPDSPK